MAQRSGSMAAGDQEILDVRPLRSLSPMFPPSLGVHSQSNSPLVGLTPVGLFPAGFPFPFTGAEPLAQKVAANGVVPGGNDPICVAPISFYKTPLRAAPATDASLADEDDDGSSGRKKKRSGKLNRESSAKRPKPAKKVIGSTELALLPPPPDDPREAVETVRMIFDALRRRLLQLDEVQEQGKRADLKAGSMMMSAGIRANATKTIGAVPGIEIGDIFYFRIEMCIVGLHAASMAGIDYMTSRFDSQDVPVAICVVSAGGYENEDDDTESLVYTGQGGVSRHDEERRDQKLERGNLALERSTQYKNEIRVVRGVRDPHCQTGRIYVYDGLYRITDSWREKSKSGYSMFKYKLLRGPGQPSGIAVWKATQRWLADPASRENMILTDLSDGTESIPVCVVNEVDGAGLLKSFSYTTQVKYPRPLAEMEPAAGCTCVSVCLPGDPNCFCGQRNGGHLPYSSMGMLASRKPLVYECGPGCMCSVNCRNKLSQRAVRYRFEVFKTDNRGWGLRSWEPIRGGTFICEYTGKVLNGDDKGDDDNDEHLFQTFCPGEKTLKWNFGAELLGEQGGGADAAAGESYNRAVVRISAAQEGNMSRFMNHSCSPNVFWQAVMHDHGDERRPHIMFFALKHIPPMTELTYDYGMYGPLTNGNATSRRRAKSCLCGAGNCRGYFG